MRIALYILLAMGLIFAGGRWALSAGQDGGASRPGPNATQALPAEEIYAPAVLKTAELSTDGDLKLSGTATPKTNLTVMADEEVLRTIRVGANSAWTIEVMVPAARIRRRIVSINLQSDLGEESLIKSEAGLLIVTEPVDFKQGLFMVRPGAATLVLQSPFDGLPRSAGLTLEAADYDDAGGVIFSGRSETPGRIRLSAGRSVLGETGPDASGRWTLISSAGLPIGSYPMRLQLIAESGEAISQIDVPFTRKPPAAITDTVEQDGLDFPAAPKPQAQFEPQRWTLTRPLSGGGMQHTLLWSPEIPAPDADQ